MTARVEHTMSIPAPPERVWDFLVDPEKRARPISVIIDFRTDTADARRATWELKLPIPLIRNTVTVETEDIERDPPEYVKFVGRSKIMRITGEHELQPIEEGTRVTSRFEVDGRLPGVEKYFKRNFRGEFDNVEQALLEELEPSIK
jgi:carbon monoxide dehydrogenase subunit G